MASSAQGGSLFWKSLHGAKEWFWLGGKFIIHSGRRVRFWQDVWWGERALKFCFPNIFYICEQQDAFVHEVVGDNSVGLTFRRNFGDIELTEWSELCNIMSTVSLDDEEDSVSWALDKSGQFSTKSLYHAMKSGGTIDLRARDLWKSPTPLKVKHFMWLVMKDRIQSAAELSKRHWEGDTDCKLCGQLETAQHILFTCPLPQSVWCILLG
jgi:hypothetical protein